MHDCVEIIYVKMILTSVWIYLNVLHVADGVGGSALACKWVAFDLSDHKWLRAVGMYSVYTSCFVQTLR